MARRVATTNGTLTDTDVDNADNSFILVTAPTSSDHYGTYTVDAIGHWNYTLDDTNTTVRGA